MNQSTLSTRLLVRPFGLAFALLLFVLFAPPSWAGPARQGTDDGATAAPAADLPLPGASIEITATVGPSPWDCPDFSVITITVDSPSGALDLDYCVTIHNTGGVTLTRHKIESNHFGPRTFDASLSPGESLNTGERVILYTATPMTTTTTVFTWTAGIYDSYGVVTATASATVIVKPYPQRSRHYVDDSATGANNGSSWADAYTDLQAALAVSDYGDEIWVAAGTYYPWRTPDATYPGPAPHDSFELKHGVAIYGGFAGNEISLDQRDWEANPTILDGDVHNSGIPYDYRTHVVTSFGTDQSSVLDGFTITHGFASTDDGNDPNCAAAASLPTDPLANPATNPVVGPAEDVSSTDLNPNAHLMGGGLYNERGNPILANLIFIDNTAEDGGGMANIDGNPTLTNVIFRNNHTHQYGIGASGGGLYSRGAPVLTHVTFEQNTSYSDFCGTLYSSYGGGMSSSGDAVLVDVSFIDNQGGGLNSSGNPTLVNVDFRNNHAGIGAGGMENYGDATLANVVFIGNSSDQVSNFGAFVSYSGNPTLINAAIVNNQGGVIYADPSSGDSHGPILRNSILWGNGDDIEGRFFGGDLSIIGERGDPDPLFVDAANGDLQLQAGSPALDAGDNSFLPPDSYDLDGDGDTAEPLPIDLAGEPRRVDGDGDGSDVVDLGAYERATGSADGTTDEQGRVDVQGDLYLPILIP